MSAKRCAEIRRLQGRVKMAAKFSDEYYEGYTAYGKALMVTANPYVDGKQVREYRWRRGWHAGRRDHLASQKRRVPK